MFERNMDHRSYQTYYSLSNRASANLTVSDILAQVHGFLINIFPEIHCDICKSYMYAVVLYFLSGYVVPEPPFEMWKKHKGIDVPVIIGKINSL